MQTRLTFHLVIVTGWMHLQFGWKRRAQVAGRQQIPSWLHQAAVVSYW